MICDFDDSLKCRRCGYQASRRVRRACEQEEVAKPLFESVFCCAHRGPVIATTTGQRAGCGCGGTTVEIYECQHFHEPVLKQAAARCLEKIRATTPGYTGRTCRECKVPKGDIILADTGLGDVVLNCWYPEAKLNVPANRVDVVRMFGGRLTTEKGTNLRASWQPELRARESRIDFRAKWYGVKEIRRPVAHLDPVAVAWAKLLRTPGRPFVVFAPQSHQREREWFPGHWLALGAMLTAQGMDIVMDLGKPDAAMNGGPWRCFVGQPIPRLAAIIAEADLTIAIDSGPAHLAGTLDRPTLLLLGPLLENSYEHMPSVQTIRSGRSCGGCNYQPPNYVPACHQACEALRDLTPEAVAERAMRMLTRTDIGVCSLATDAIADVREVTRANLESYCRLQDYGLHYATKSKTDRPASWGKIPMLQRYLHEHDWLWWADADLVVTGPTRRLEELTDGATGDLLIAQDSNGINCGSFLLRNCDWSHDFLRRVWETTEPHEHCWWEQWAIMQLLEVSQDDRSHVQIVRKRAINSYPSDWRQGDFCLHTPGVSDRVTVLRNAVEAAAIGTRQSMLQPFARPASTHQQQPAW